jgi:hypothetical protein
MVRVGRFSKKIQLIGVKDHLLGSKSWSLSVAIYYQNRDDAMRQLKSLPDFLVDYRLFDELIAWADKNPSQERFWRVSRTIKTSFDCHITWKFQNELHNIRQFADSPEEATWLALEEFKKWEHSL